MDPEATLTLAQNEIECGEYAQAIARLFDYYGWRVKGGFEPNRGDERAASMARELLMHLDNTRGLGRITE